MSETDERERELEEAGIHAARAARSLLAVVMHEVSDALQERTAQVVSHLYSAEVGGLDRVTRALTAACAELQELTYVEGTSATYAHALTLLYPISRELSRASGPPVAISPADPILLLATKKKITLTPDDRRRLPRVELEVDIGVHSETNFYAGFSGDVSEGGIFVATYKPLPIGTKTTVSFVMPGGHHVVTEGEVKWVREAAWDVTPGMGITFTKLSDHDRKMIQWYAQQRTPLFFDV
ncbi:MAG: TIGR02266 family protein [Sandaracinaceae bacterium]|nr:TIGR02266 family protein [Sandaracinaceae bacterium]